MIPFKKISQDTTAELIKGYLDEYEKRGSLPSDKRQLVEQELRTIDQSDARGLQRAVQLAIFKALAQKP